MQNLMSTFMEWHYSLSHAHPPHTLCDFLFSLELQLKSHHLPFKILKKWHDILESLATGDTYSEEPTMYWKKDAMTHQALEKRVTGPLASRLLFDELAFNVSYSFYPTTLAEAVNMAALALKVAKAEKGVKSDISNVFGCSMPPHLESGTWGWSWRRKVWKAYNAIAKEDGDKNTWRQRYLTTGRKWNYYGATFFYGGLEHEVPGNPDHVCHVNHVSRRFFLLHAILSVCLIFDSARFYQCFSSVYLLNCLTCLECYLFDVWLLLFLYPLPFCFL